MGRGEEPTWLDLYDYRRRVAALYAERDRGAMEGENAISVLERFKAGKDEVFAKHPQSALNKEQREKFAGLSYFPYNIEMRVVASMRPATEVEGAKVIQAADGPHTLTLRPAAFVEFVIGGSEQRLTVYWIDVYGGGLFLPFRDATCPDESYGGGRYLFDTVKGSTFLRIDEDGGLAPVGEGEVLGYGGGQVVLDFNYAYNPSCAFDSRWVCPLAPPDNRMKVRIEAGERRF